MKNRISIIVLLSALVLVLVTGCKKESLELSWTDYNSVDDVWLYFKNNKNLNDHQGDTIKVRGWLYCNYETMYHCFNQYLCGIDYPDSVFVSAGIVFFTNPCVFLFMGTDSISSHSVYHRPVCVTGTVGKHYNFLYDRDELQINVSNIEYE